MNTPFWNPDKPETPKVRYVMTFVDIQISFSLLRLPSLFDFSNLRLNGQFLNRLKT